jgi:hypothetical protein
MQQIDFDLGIEKALDSLLTERLTLLAGAGLSMAAPSSLPSAYSIAVEAKRRYDAMHGASRAPLPLAIEEQAEFFFQRDELSSVYFRTLIDQNIFAAPPNEGHYAVADLLLVQGIETAVTTNVDVLVETAGQILYGQIGTGLDQAQMAALPPRTSPLLKIHGCRQKDHDHMVWAPGQINAAPVADRIASSTHWLSNRLLDRDLLIVGYWTDWDYLNQVLQTVLDQIRPSKVIVVDLADSATFQAKAPALYTIGESVQNGFWHIQASSDAFLAALRKAFSKAFLRQVINCGTQEYQDRTGNAATPAMTEPPDIDNDALWRMRRDLEGCTPNQPASLRAPPLECTVGLTLLQLRASGADADGHYWLLNQKRIRALRTPNQLLHRIEAAYARETPPAISPDITIAIGAEADSLPSHIVRVGTAPTIARGTAGRWLTRQQAIEELGL